MISTLVTWLIWLALAVGVASQALVLTRLVWRRLASGGRCDDGCLE